MNTTSIHPIVTWHSVSNPIHPDESLPAERRTVLVWLRGHALPFCGYIRYAAGDKYSPYFVVYHGNREIGSDVIAWCDCLPDNGPDVDAAKMYTKQQAKGRGFPSRVSSLFARRETGSKALTECAAERDGDCNHEACPQLKYRQPHCPLDNAEPSVLIKPAAT